MYDSAQIANAAQIKLPSCEALPDCSRLAAIRLARFNLLGDATDDMTAKDGYPGEQASQKADYRRRMREMTAAMKAKRACGCTTRSARPTSCAYGPSV